MRIDIELVNRGLVSTRNKAQEAIKNGFVLLNNKKVNKNSVDIKETDILTLQEGALKYVSRAGLKLEKAIEVFNITLKDKVICDIGSSTGGFTDCALKNGAKEVYAIDVGSGQLDKSLRIIPKIHLYENTDFRDIDVSLLKDVEIITIDVSFISVKKLIDKISQMNACEIICLIKPQFECGKQVADKYKGIILDKNVHLEVIKNIVKSFESIGFNMINLTYSPIKGGSGNIEYLLYLKKEGFNKIIIQDIINSAFKSLCRNNNNKC